MPAPAPVAILLLAAGRSARMGRPKQLLDFGGRPLLRHAAETALSAGVGPVVVVLGSEADRIRQALVGLSVDVALNDRWPDGMGTSIQAGLGAVESLCPAGVILALADQPRVTAAHLRDLVDRHRETGKPIVASRYAGTVGVPVFFAAPALSWLAALAPDQGCKGVILAHPDDAILIDCPDAATDLDTPDDYARAVGATESM